MKTILKAIGMIFRFIWKTITLFRHLVTNLLFLMGWSLHHSAS
ncbi:hypothetical protein [Vibrio ruber]|nr:hypothetical protein [Vibrio ruber]